VRLFALKAIGVSVIIGTGCSGRDHSTRQTTTTTAVQAATAVQLVPAPSTLATSCARAARRLNFSVPCPGLVPTVNGRAAACDNSASASLPTVADCSVTNPNAPPAFFFDVAPFDAPPDYKGVDGRAGGHFNITVFPAAAAPTSCWHGRPLGLRLLHGMSVSAYDCPDAFSFQAQREIQHGEALFSQHLLYQWRTSQAASFVSVHGGDTPTNRTMLDRIVDSVQPVTPT
jgi:hypothetical protein